MKEFFIGGLAVVAPQSGCVVAELSLERWDGTLASFMGPRGHENTMSWQTVSSQLLLWSSSSSTTLIIIIKIIYPIIEIIIISISRSTHAHHHHFFPSSSASWSLPGSCRSCGDILCQSDVNNCRASKISSCHTPDFHRLWRASTNLAADALRARGLG